MKINYMKKFHVTFCMRIVLFRPYNKFNFKTNLNS